MEVDPKPFSHDEFLLSSTGSSSDLGSVTSPTYEMDDSIIELSSPPTSDDYQDVLMHSVKEEINEQDGTSLSINGSSPCDIIAITSPRSKKVKSRPRFTFAVEILVDPKRKRSAAPSPFIESKPKLKLPKVKLVKKEEVVLVAGEADQKLTNVPIFINNPPPGNIIDILANPPPPSTDVVPADPTSELVALKPFARNTMLGGKINCTMSIASRPYYENYRITLDSVCNIACRGPGEAFFCIGGGNLFEQLATTSHPASIFIADEALFKRTRKFDPNWTLQSGEYWYFYGRYRCKYKLVLKDDDYNNASALSQSLLIDAMMGYRTSSSKMLDLDSWNFTDTRGMSIEEARVSMRLDFEENLPQRLDFLYFEYAGVVDKDWEEIAVISRLRDISRTEGSDALAAAKVPIVAERDRLAKIKSKKLKELKLKEKMNGKPKVGKKKKVVKVKKEKNN